MEAWRAGFQSANPDVNVYYDPVGSGGGRTQFLEGGVDFAGSDAALDDEELAAAAERCAGGEAIDLPLYISPIAVIYNLPGVDELNLSPAGHRRDLRRQDHHLERPGDRRGQPRRDAPRPGRSRRSTARTSPARPRTSPSTSCATAGEAWPYEAERRLARRRRPVRAGHLGRRADGPGRRGHHRLRRRLEGRLARHREDQGRRAVGRVLARGRGRRGRRLAAGRGPRASTTSSWSSTARRPPTGAYPLVLISYSLACTTYEDPADAELVKAFLGYIASAEGQEAAASAAGVRAASPTTCAPTSRPRSSPSRPGPDLRRTRPAPRPPAGDRPHRSVRAHRAHARDVDHLPHRTCHRTEHM